MIFHGEAVRLRDERLVHAVKSAWEASGFRTESDIPSSVAICHLVQGSLAPRRHWWICDLDDDGRLFKCRIMTTADHARTSEKPRH